MTTNRRIIEKNGHEYRRAHISAAGPHLRARFRRLMTHSRFLMRADAAISRFAAARQVMAAAMRSIFIGRQLAHYLMMMMPCRQKYERSRQRHRPTRQVYRTRFQKKADQPLEISIT